MKRVVKAAEDFSNMSAKQIASMLASQVGSRTDITEAYILDSGDGNGGFMLYDDPRTGDFIGTVIQPHDAIMDESEFVEEFLNSYGKQV